MRRRIAAIGRGDADHDAALQPRADALVDAFEFRRRPVGRDDHLLAAVEQRVQHVAEFLLHRLAGQELHVVDQQDVDGAEPLLEIERRAVAKRGDELDGEALDGQIERTLAAAGRAARLVRDGLQEMRLAEAHAGMEIERIVGGRLPSGAPATARAARQATSLERPSQKVANVSRGSTGEPAKRSLTGSLSGITCRRSVAIVDRLVGGHDAQRAAADDVDAPDVLDPPGATGPECDPHSAI